MIHKKLLRKIRKLQHVPEHVLKKRTEQSQLQKTLSASLVSCCVLPISIILSALLLSACEQSPETFQQQGVKPTQYINYLKTGQQADGVLVKFTSTTGSASRARSLFNAGLTTTDNEFQLVPGLTLTQTNANFSINDTLSTLSADPTVAYAEPNYIWTVNVTPNDSRFNSQWGLNNSGDNDIDAPEAWDVTKGNTSVIIAVIDSGVDYRHPDLQGQIWTNAGEIPNNNRDDDNNGFVDDVRGWDFGSNDNDPMDENNHGTHVSGVIGAKSNNGSGVAGINWNVQIMPLKFMNAQGQGSTAAAIRALDYAVKNGARISNNSWGGGSFSQSLFDAIQSANRQDHLFIAASGNDGVNTDGGTNFPSTYNLPNIISVAASNQNDQLTSFSNFGRTTVDLAAPGDQIMSTVRNNGYQSMRGTSMAAPFVTGVAGLVLSQNLNLTAAELKAAILDNVDRVNSLSGKLVTGGRLNALNAVNGVPSTAPTTPVTAVTISRPTNTTLNIGDALQLIATGGDGNFSWQSSNASVASISNSGTLIAQNNGSTRISVRDGNNLVSPAIIFNVITQASNTLVISPASLSQINLNDVIQLSISNGTAPYTWSTSNNNIASITTGTTSTQIARLTPNTSGTFSITVSDAIGSIAQTGVITVSAPSLNVNAAKTTINVAETLQLSIAGGTSPYTWQSSRTAIISVNSGGIVKGIREGSSTINITDAAGNSTSINIQVINPIAGNLTLTPGKNIFGINSRAAIKATGGGKTITWSSSNPTVATVDYKGIVLAKAVGITQIDATDETGRTGSINFEVRTIAVTGANLTIGAGDTLQLTADGGLPPYTWNSSNKSLASIDSNGLLTSFDGAFGGILITTIDADNIKKSIIITINNATSLRAPRSQ